MDNKKTIFPKDLTDYRPIPFWSWNDRLDPTELVRQIHLMHERGFGGFFMHARGGLETEYLGRDWFDCIRACVNESKKVGMRAWSYDENGWPSGFAGMKLLEDPKNHEHYLEKNITDAFDPTATASYFLDGKTLRHVTEPVGRGTYVNVFLRTNPSVVDILNPAIVRKFIDLTHERYKKECGEDFGRYMLGFFTDEPQYYRWATPYSPVVCDYFRAAFGIDLWENLGKLFVSCDGAYAFRYKYYDAMHRFYIDSFVRQIYEWCEENGCMLTGHAVEESTLYGQMWCTGGLMDFYEYEHIPGCDWLGRKVGTEIEPKQIGSACEQLGKKHVLTETFACCGWDVTPRELRKIAEWQYVNGVNLMCQHLSAYSVRGQRKRDYPLTYSEHMPWYDKMGDFNDYFAKLGYLLSESENQVDTLILHPIKSAYLDYDRETDEASIRDLESSFTATVESFGKMQIPHHFGDENIMRRHASVRDGKLIIGACSYTYVYLPRMKCMDKFTYNLLVEFLNQGGKLVTEGGFPSYLEGEPFDFPHLHETATLSDIRASVPYRIETLSDGIRSAYRVGDFGRFLYIVNIGDVKADLRVRTPFSAAYVYDLVADEKYIPKTDGDAALLTIPAGASVLLFEGGAHLPVAKAQAGENLLPDGIWNLTSPVKNSLTIDKAALSYDGVTWTSPAYLPSVFFGLIEKQYIGNIYLRYTFEVKHKTEQMFLECERMGIGECRVNGKPVSLTAGGTLDRSFLTADISSCVTEGTNDITFLIDFYQSPHVYEVLSDITPEKESLKNCLTYDTEPESIYIRGDFGVYDDGLRSTGTDILLSDGGYYVDRQSPTVHAENITADGFLFFSGCMTLEREMRILPGRCRLCPDGRFAVADVYVDGRFVRSLMFDTVADLSAFADGGVHTVRLAVYSSARNLYGPHHFTEYEPMSVSPFSFDLAGTWKDGKSRFYRDGYSFVKFSFA